jgi:hypothetical protein
MKPATHETFGIAKRRGFWLRCFLGLMRPIGVSTTIAVLAHGLPVCRAQCVYPKISVSQIRGAVFDRTGRPIPNADVNLKRDGQLVSSTKTDGAGGFFVGAPAGTYDLTVNARIFAPGFARIEAGMDLVRVLRPTRLWMILDVGLTTDACTFVSTSRRQFESAIQENRR